MKRTRVPVLERPRSDAEGVAPATRPDATCAWDPDLVERVYRLLLAVDPASPAFAEGLEALRVRYHDLVYGELLYLLSHLRFDPGEAKQHWERILAHRSTMRGAGSKPVDVRVALVSYFVEVNPKLENPKIIEMKLFEQTREFAYRDELTGLHNYRIFREYLEQEILRSRRYRQPLSLVMIDIDNFKAYNDRHGHEAGNEALVAVAGLLGQSLRRTDVAARYGGEEFAMILPATRKTSARLVAERAREAIESSASALTASFGIATSPADADGAADLVRHADRALYVAKANGKNQVQLYGKNQRSFSRADLVVEGSFRAPTSDRVPLTTVNISEGGLLFCTSLELAAGTLIDFELRMPRSAKPLCGAGRVIHADAGPSGSYRVAATIIELDEAGRAALADQLRLLVHGRDSDGD